LFRCIDSVLACPDIDELILVNHDNPAGTVAVLEQRARLDHRLRLIHSGANLGFARGCNLGARSAHGEALLFLNPDALLRPGGARRMFEDTRERTEPVIVGACLIGEDGCEQRGARRGVLTLCSAIGAFLGLSPQFHREHDPLPEQPVPVPTVSGAAMLMTRKGFDAVGRFDEGYFLHVEDIDICKRARDAGGDVVFEPRVQITHVGSTSQVSQIWVDLHKAMGLARYFTRHGGWSGPLKGLMFSPVFILAAVTRSVLIRLGAGRAR